MSDTVVTPLSRLPFVSRPSRTTGLASVPAFLPEVPVDPHDGKRLRYRRLTEGVVIYWVGPDMIDNGGNLGRQNAVGGGKDVGVQLWDVNCRRKPPAP